MGLPPGLRLSLVDLTVQGEKNMSGSALDQTTSMTHCFVHVVTL